MSLVLAALPALLLIGGFPIFVVLLTASVFALAFYMNMPMSAVQQNMFGSVSSTGLLAIPYFIFAGELMSRGTVSLRLVDFVRALVGRLPGALGVTTVGTATVFGAISGSSAAAVASVGRIMHPAMLKDGYPMRFAVGLVTSVGAIGIVVPPSIPMLVYAAASETSIPRLYAAGVLPGLLIALILVAYILAKALRLGLRTSDITDRSGFLNAARRAFWALGMIVVILGGIYGGVFSPTEAAAVACVYALAVTLFVYREMGFRDILDAASSTVIFSAQILIIVAAAGLYSWILAVNQLPQNMAAWIVSMEVSPWLFLLAVNILLLLLGCVMDPISAILLLTPVLAPVVDALGIDKVHFGIVITLNLAIGMFTPPFGINIFVAQSVLKTPTGDIYMGVLPFFYVFLAALIIVTFIPAVSLLSADLFMFGG